LHGCFLELRRVHLVRYLEHSFFPSFGSSLYTTYWKAKFQGKLMPPQMGPRLASLLPKLKPRSLPNGFLDVFSAIVCKLYLSSKLVVLHG
jgi:hypothetical protein